MRLFKFEEYRRLQCTPASELIWQVLMCNGAVNDKQPTHESTQTKRLPAGKYMRRW